MSEVKVLPSDLEATAEIAAAFPLIAGLRSALGEAFAMGRAQADTLGAKLASILYSGALDEHTCGEIRGWLASYEARVACDRVEGFAQMERSVDEMRGKLDICKRYAEMEGADGDHSELAVDYGWETDPAVRAVHDLMARHAELIASHAALAEAAVALAIPVIDAPDRDRRRERLAAMATALASKRGLSDADRCGYASVLLAAAGRGLREADRPMLADHAEGAGEIASRVETQARRGTE